MPEVITGDYTVTNTDEPTEDKLSVLLRGREKSGKTHYAVSFPKPIILYSDMNMATLRKHPNVQYISIPDYATYHWKILPDLLARQDPFPEFETIINDSLSDLFVMCKAYEAPRFKGFDFWGAVLDDFTGDLRKLLSLTRASEGKQTFNVVCTCRESDVMSGETLERIGLAVQGQSANQIANLFDSVFCTDSSQEITIGEPGQPATRKTTHFIYTSSPTEKRQCGDGVGGGRYKILPPKLYGTYPELAAAWGRE